jgi:hypothetical protein
MSPRGLTQHGGQPGWLEESDPAGVILNVMNGPYRLPFPYRTGCPGCEMMEFPAAFCIYSPYVMEVYFIQFTSIHLHTVCSAREPTPYKVHSYLRKCTNTYEIAIGYALYSGPLQYIASFMHLCVPPAFNKQLFSKLAYVQ